MLYFATYEWCKDKLEAKGLPSAVTHLASASAGAVMSAFVRVPTDTIKHRVQAYMEADVFMVSAQACFEMVSPILHNAEVISHAAMLLVLMQIAMVSLPVLRTSKPMCSW